MAHILNANALIFLADPWSMPGFIDRLAFHLQPDPSINAGRMPVDTLTHCIEGFRAASGQMWDERFSLPVAVALSKADLIPYMISKSRDPLYSALADPQYPSLLNKEESVGIDTVVRQLLSEIGEESLASLKEKIERINFFAISATGAAPNSRGEFPQVRPHRCLDPLF